MEPLKVKLCAMSEQNVLLKNQVETLVGEQCAARQIFFALDSKISASKIAYGECKHRSDALENENEALKIEQGKLQGLLRGTSYSSATEWLKDKKELDKLSLAHQELERLRGQSDSLLEMYNAVVEELQACKRNAMAERRAEDSPAHLCNDDVMHSGGLTLCDSHRSVADVVDSSTYATWKLK